MNNWMKYLAIASAFMSVGMRVFSWLQFAQSSGSLGGDKITPGEIVQLTPIIQDAINQGLSAAGVPVVVNVQITYLGE